MLALVRLAFSDGGDALYSLPLLVGRDGSLRDAFEDLERLRIIGHLMAHGETLDGTSGSFHFGGPGLDPLAPPGSGSIRAVSAEQSNSSMVLDDNIIVKLFRRVQVGINPDLEINRLLTNEGFENIPAQVGEILYEGSLDDVDISIDLGIAQQLIKGAREGWVEALQELHHLYDSADESPDLEMAVSERAEHLLNEIEDLGDVTASLHVLLSREDMEQEFAPEPIDGADLKEWAESARAALEGLLQGDGSELEAHKAAIEERIDRLQTIDDAGSKTRVHGDYHLGQVMLGSRGWFIIDFEGEPMRSMAERRAKQSPLRDVAGMLRSFSYAATVAMFERTEVDSEEWKRLQPWADAWETLARQRFFTAYHRSALEGGFMPGDREDLKTMLEVFEIDKALYELGYEQAHRPGWDRIPRRGITRLLQEDLLT